MELSGIFSRYAKLLADFYFRSNWGHQLHVPMNEDEEVGQAENLPCMPLRAPNEIEITN